MILFHSNNIIYAELCLSNASWDTFIAILQISRSENFQLYYSGSIIATHYSSREQPSPATQVFKWRWDVSMSDTAACAAQMSVNFH